MQQTTEVAIDSGAANGVLSRLADEHRLLLELLPQQIWTAAPDGMLDSVNEHGERYFGIPRDALLGAGWLSVIHGDDVAATMAQWQRSLATGEPYEHAFRLRRHDGTYRWHLVRAIARPDETGAIVKWMGSNTDIDDARRAHDELRLRVDYEQQLIGIVSHDLRNPLSVIGISASLLESSADPATAKIVAHIASATQRAGQLITDLLDFAQARTGTFPVQPAPTNLPVLTRRAVEDARLLSGPRRVEIAHSGPEVGTWDEGRIAQVIANLVGNAFQHAPPDAPITVRSRIDGERTTIEVHNGGPPISTHDQPRLFEPFARGRSARTHRGRSVGLGLFIARQIVRAHRGELTVQSVDGKGTTFRVELPTRVA